MVVRDYIPYPPINMRTQAYLLVWSRTTSCEQDDHSSVWMSNVSSQRNWYDSQAYLSSGNHQISLCWSPSKDDHHDDASLSEYIPSLNNLASLSVDVLDLRIAELRHKPFSTLTHIPWQHQKSMMVVCPGFLVFSGQALASLLLPLRFCRLHDLHEDDWHALSAFHARSYLYLVALHIPFFALVANISPKGVHLSFVDMVIFQKHFLYLLDMTGSVFQPVRYSFVFYIFHSCYCCNAHSFSKHCQCFEDVLLGCASTIEKSSFCFSERYSACFTDISLSAIRTMTGTIYVFSVSSSIVSALFVITEFVGSIQFSFRHRYISYVNSSCQQYIIF
jgi:hypothetical protein